MSSRHRASYTKRRKNILVEKLSDNSNNSSSSNEEKNPKSIKKKIRPRRKKADFEEKEQENKVRYFPNQSIFYPELFLENLEIINRFKCGLCERICENPRFQTCGCDQIYCEKCLNIFYDIYHHQCPKCQNETKELNPSDGFIETLMNLRMRCCNYKNNCNWVGVYKEFKIHKTKNCPKEIINCPNKDCCYKDLRENMPTHTEKCEYRDYFCRDCLDKIPYFEKRVHKNYCPKAKIFCPQGCGESIEREEISEHKKECINSEIQCPFKIFGCRDKFKRSMKDERLIQDTNKHLNLTAKVVFELKNQIKKMQKTIDELQKNNINNRNNNDNINNNDQENNTHIPEDNNINKKDKDIKFLEKKRETIDNIPDNMFPQNNFHFSIFDGDIINNNNNNAILNSEIESDDYIYDEALKQERRRRETVEFELNALKEKYNMLLDEIQKMNNQNNQDFEELKNNYENTMKSIEKNIAVRETQKYQNKLKDMENKYQSDLIKKDNEIEKLKNDYEYLQNRYSILEEENKKIKIQQKIRN